MHLCRLKDAKFQGQIDKVNLFTFKKISVLKKHTYLCNMYKFANFTKIFFLKQLPLKILSVWSQFMCSEYLPRIGKWILNNFYILLFDLC